MKKYLFQTQLAVKDDLAPVIHYGFDFTIEIDDNVLRVLTTGYKNCQYFVGISR